MKLFNYDFERNKQFNLEQWLRYTLAIGNNLKTLKTIRP